MSGSAAAGFAQSLSTFPSRVIQTTFTTSAFISVPGKFPNSGRRMSAPAEFMFCRFLHFRQKWLKQHR
jgi:hypothetical protein